MVSKTKNLVISTLSVLFLVAWQAPISFADNSLASLSIIGGTYTPSSAFSVPVYENSGGNEVNLVKSDLNYNVSQLELISIDTSTSAFGGALPSSNLPGSVSVLRYATPPGSSVTGNALVAILNFKPLTDVKSSIITFASSSAILSSSTNNNIWDGSTKGATFDFATPSPTNAPAAAPVSQAPPPAKTTPQSAQAKAKPLDSTLGAAATATRLPAIAPSFPVSKADTTRWMAFIAICSVLILMLLARLFNVHKKIRAKSPWVYIEKVIKRIF